jgi:prepilin-type N-terminal cleavage/methylation domain-containing protein
MKVGQQRGFTLVEMLIVIVILGILAAIVVFAVGNLTGNAKRDSCKTEGQTFQTAIEANKAAGGAPVDATDAPAAATTLKNQGHLSSATLGYLDDSENGPYTSGWTYDASLVATNACA